MKHLLLFDLENDLKAGVENILAESFTDTLSIETVRSLSEVLKKSAFFKNTIPDPVGDKLDIFVVCLKEMDAETWNFVQYVTRNNPQLPVVVISRRDSNWPAKRFISKTEKKPIRALTKEDLVDKIGVLLTDLASG